MVEQLSPLAPVWRPGTHGNVAAAGVGVTLSETQPGSIVQVAAWPGQASAMLAAIAKASGLKLPDVPGGGAAARTKAAFAFAPGRLLLVDEQEGLAGRLTDEITAAIGTVTDLSHGRTAIRIAGPKAEWVLSKLFALDLSEARLPVGHGVSTNHHDIFALIQRSARNQFDIYVFRSFARSFWRMLCHAAEETGYEVR